MSDTDTVTFEQRVNDALTTMDAEGNLPEGTPEEVVYAAKATKRMKDHQAAFTKAAQEKKALTAERDELLKHAAALVPVEVTPEQQYELDTLKSNNPDAWRAKMNELEGTARTANAAKLAEISRAASESVTVEEQLAHRQVYLDAFVAANPTLVITDQSVELNVPPRLTKQLESGDITFEEYLEASKPYLDVNKSVDPGRAPQNLDLTRIPGGSAPAESAYEGDIVNSYDNEVY